MKEQKMERNKIKAKIKAKMQERGVPFLLADEIIAQYKKRKIDQYGY